MKLEIWGGGFLWRGGVSLRKRHSHSPGGLAASTQGESGIMETVRPGPHLAGVLCNSLEVSSFARPGARAPRPAARPDLARPGRGAGTPSARASRRAARPDPQRGLHTPRRRCRRQGSGLRAAGSTGTRCGRVSPPARGPSRTLT